jgi:conjugal transfer ATP-binding protein TraC
MIDNHMLSLQDLFSPDLIVENFDNIQFVNNQYMRIFALQGYPRQNYIGWLDDIFNIGDVDITTYIHPANEKKVVGDILAKETKATSQWYIDKSNGNISRIPELERQIGDYQELRDVVQLGQDKLFYITTFIAIHAISQKELQQKCDQLDSILARKNMLARTLVLRQLDGLKASVPLGSHKFPKYEKNMTSHAGACCLPLTIASGGHSNGVQLGYNVFSQTPIFLNRFAGEHIIPNQHLFICGETGSGKSVTLRLLALLEAYRGIATAFVDPEGEYVNITKSAGGKVVSLQPGKFSGINPLDIEPEKDDDDKLIVNVQAKIEDIQALISSVFKYYSSDGLEIQEVALLEESILEEYRVREITRNPKSLYAGGIKKTMPTLSDMQKRIASKPGAERLANGIKPLLRGGSVGMFDGQTTVQIEDELMICFNLRGLGGEFSRFVGIQAILSWLWQKFAQRGGREVSKCVAVDEAWMFLRYPGAAQYLEILARRGRKHGCALTIATQRFEEFSSTSEGRAVIESCASVLVLRQEEHAAEAVVDYFHLSEGCLGLIIPPAKAGQGIMRVSGTTTAIQVSPAPFEWGLVQTVMQVRK